MFAKKISTGLTGTGKPTILGWLLLIVSISAQILFAQTTGKLAGRVVDTEGNPLIGVNVVIEGTTQGAATDMDGYYVILNVRAGTYMLRFFYVGYQSKVVENVKVSPDKTTHINVELAEETIEGEEVVVTAQKPLVEFNETSSVSTVTTEDIELLPVQDLNEIVNLQAGVIDGHFRGGRIGEVQYQVDGVTVNNPYDNSSTLQLDRSVLKEVQVISGTFDAKYGQAMSGVVNAVLKSGSQKLEWSGEAYGGDFFTTDDDRYPHNQIEDLDPSGIQYYQLTLSGPTPLPQTTFFINGRRFLNDGYLFGERRFLPTDSSNFETRDFNAGGDGNIVPMATRREWSGQIKLSNKAIPKIELNYQAILNNIEATQYDHAFRLNPEGITQQNTLSVTHGIDFTHSISNKLFYKLSVRQNYYEYTDYKYENVFDPRYLEAGRPRSDANYEFGAVVQGVDLTRFKQETNAAVVKGDFTWQANRSNLIEAGVEGQLSEISFGSPGFLRPTNIGGRVVLQPHIGTEPEDPKVETYYPRQFSTYIQDRLEWRNLVLRAGVRLESFDANTTVPSDLQNPANAISGAPESTPKETSIKTALAPRLGFSFPLSSSASLYFSYGHFYQMPGLGNLYNNSNYKVLDDLQEGGISFGVLGNPNLKPELTVQYEFGLKQALTDKLGWEVTFFYKDIRDLLGVQFVSTYAAAEYARFTNVDFGRISGFTVALDQRPIGPISTTVDYTMQFAFGNSSDPRETANRREAGKDPRPRVIPFDWDQRHTLNATAIFAKPQNYIISTIFRFGGGQPYTPQIGSGFNADLESNSGRKSSFLLIDLRAEKFFSFGPADISLFLRVFNLLNTHFVNGFVFTTTGSPDYSQFPQANRSTLLDPSRFHEPRRIEIGIRLSAK